MKKKLNDDYKPFLIVIPHFYEIAKKMLKKTYFIVKDQKVKLK